MIICQLIRVLMHCPSLSRSSQCITIRVMRVLKPSQCSPHGLPMYSHAHAAVFQCIANCAAQDSNPLLSLMIHSPIDAPGLCVVSPRSHSHAFFTFPRVIIHDPVLRISPTPMRKAVRLLSRRLCEGIKGAYERCINIIDRVSVPLARPK